MKTALPVAFTRDQLNTLERAARAMRCTPSELVCALALAQLEALPDDEPSANHDWLAGAVASFADEGRAPRWRENTLSAFTRPGRTA